MTRLGAVGGGAEPKSMGPGADAVQGSVLVCAALTAVERLAICWVIVCTA